MEFNIYIKIFDKIKEFDVKPTYSIIQVKEYIRKFLKISFDFDLYYNSNKITNGTIMSNNITEDNIIIFAPIMMTGKTLQTKYNPINFDSIESVKVYLKTNFSSSDTDDEGKNEIENKNIITEKDMELNMKTKKKLEMLKKLYSK